MKAISLTVDELIYCFYSEGLFENGMIQHTLLYDSQIYTFSIIGEDEVQSINISDTEIQAAIEQYVLPYVDKYCLARWRNQMGNPTRYMKKED